MSYYPLMSGVAIILGGSRGIGAASARQAAEAGYDVCISYVTHSKAADRVVAECEVLGRKALAVKADVGNAKDVAELFNACDNTLGPVSLLLNNAGIIGKATTVADLPDDALARTFEVNVYGTIYCAREAIQRMATSKGSNGGVIVNISSVAARLGSPGEYVHYASSKAAIETFTVGLAKEIGGEGIRVNALQAGTTDTDIHRSSGNPDRPAMVAAMSPLGRVASPDDIAAGIFWLASTESSYVTGAILPVSGGL